MNTTSQKLLLSAIVAGFLVGAPSNKVFADEGASDEQGKFECQGGNSCKGKGACGGVGHSCAGKNACKGKGYVYTKDKAECDKLLTDLQKKPKKKSS